MLRGEYAWGMGELDDAQESLTKALALDGDYAEAHLVLGMTYQDLGKRRQACEHYRTFIRLGERGPRGDLTEARRGESENCR